MLEERLGGADLAEIVAWFDQGGALKVPGDERAELCFKGFSVVPGLLDAGGASSASRPSRITRAPWPPASWCSRASPPQKRISRSEELGYTRVKPERREPGYREGGDFVWVRGGAEGRGEAEAGRSSHGECTAQRDPSRRRSPFSPALGMTG